ncbi:hypothetical protein EDD52_12250 [Primorskyibacter sedentarius]|uniref:Uncharacterized protein n=1 Tax=Primorskyibacter sedentarius TaxID=745311 RepID=A0A4R3J332_9RHOB|nr:hypothetical protein [Primorskyibacter sedentarius]TCS59091.1 hypothetical protein EDD52_12250 [Primorskyibacter sedentarius]
MPDIVFDEKVYDAPAVLFLNDLTERMVLAFARAGIIKLSASGMSLEDEDVCYELLFSFLIVIEGLNRLQASDGTYLPTIVFAQFTDGIGPAPKPSSALSLIGTDVRTKFHGDLDAAIIQNAARKVGKRCLRPALPTGSAIAR